MDFAKTVCVDTEKLEWQPSPAKGVWRKKLAREEAEQGHATSIVRYAAGARFAQHDHPKGEEILVLDGVFSDHTGDYSAGCYFRNPQGFRHAPFSERGCTILVKLHQFQVDDITHRVVEPKDQDYKAGNQLGIIELHSHRQEQVQLQRWSKGASIVSDAASGEELYVLSGGLQANGVSLSAGTWFRRCERQTIKLEATCDTVIWKKTGHLNT